MDRHRILGTLIALLIASVPVLAEEEDIWESVPVLAEEEDIWERLHKQPLELYKTYGNPVDHDSTKDLSRILFNDDFGQENSDTSEVSVTSPYLPNIDDNAIDNLKCISDVSKMIRVWTSPNLIEKVLGMGHYWPIFIPDSWGKVGDGILNGNTLNWGFLEECTSAFALETITDVWPHFVSNFKGKYCLVHVTKHNTSIQYDVSPEVDLETKVYQDIYSSPEFYWYGTCMPDSCQDKDVKVSLENSFKESNWDVSDVKCQTLFEGFHLDNGGEIGFMVVVGIIWCLAVTAASIEFFINFIRKPELKEGPLKFFLAISSYRSLTKIFQIVNKTNPDVIDCLQGMRVLSMIWVTWYHSYTLFAPVTQNMKGLEVISDSPLDQIIFNGSFSGDTFFFMSGLLATYCVLRENAETGKVNWIMYYVHRILRLMPAIGLTCFFMATVAKHALVGPYGPYIEADYLEPCRSYWYMDVLFVSNFADKGGMCLPQSWYTSIDFQLYIILPLVLIPLLKRPKIGMIILGGLTAASFIIPIALFGAFNLKLDLPFVVPEKNPEETTLNHEHMPWNRASPYFIGVWAGLLLFKFKDKIVKMSWWQVTICWCLSITFSLLLLLGLTPYNKQLEIPEEMPSWIAICYGGFSRGIWALSLLWVVFACKKGLAGPVNSFLGHPSWLPLSRLAFSMFLITVPVQLLSSGSTYIPLYMNHLNKFIETCGYLFVSGLMAVGVAVTSEIPILALEKMIIPRPGRNVQEEPIKES